MPRSLARAGPGKIHHHTIGIGADGRAYRPQVLGLQEGRLFSVYSADNQC
jgi:hypothetical protein